MENLYHSDETTYYLNRTEFTHGVLHISATCIRVLHTVNQAKECCICNGPP
jgi:hypothetical protein